MPQVTLSLTTTTSAALSPIPVSLHLHAEARGLDELWTGRTSPDARRKLQNRLNQRAYRKRKAVEKASKLQVFELEPAPIQLPEKAEASRDLIGLDTAVLPIRQGTRQAEEIKEPNMEHLGRVPLPPLHTASWCRPFESFLRREQPVAEHTSPGKLSETIKFEESFLRNLKPTDFYRLPADDHLLSLMYYNVFRALTTNVRLLNLDTYLMHTDAYPSPFITGTAYTRPIPPHLQPTQLQRTVPHHPCFDIFPDPVVRDHGIRNTHLLPHGTLCMTLAGRNTWFENERSMRSGLVIWGAPEDANSWEVTEGFIANWGWLVKGSLMLQYSTNRWRAVRGERAIFFA